MVISKKIGLVSLKEDVTQYTIDIPSLMSLGYAEAKVIIYHNEQNNMLYTYIQTEANSNMKFIGTCYVELKNIHPLTRNIINIDFNLSKQISDAKEIISKAILLKQTPTITS